VTQVGAAIAGPTLVEVADQGLWSWITTVDHKRIGILYGVSAGVFFVLGGLEALVIRLQLWTPNNTLVSAQAYNALFTMHATTMIFWRSCRWAPPSSISSFRCRLAPATWRSHA